MPQNSTIIPSLFYHLSSSFRVHSIIHHHFAIISPLFYHLSSSFRVHHSPPIIIIPPSFRLYFTTYHHQCAIIPPQSFTPPIIIISPLLRLYFTTYYHHSAIILPLLPLSSSISPLQHLSSSFHHHSAIIPSLWFPPIIIISPSFHLYDFHLSLSFRAISPIIFTSPPISL